MRFYKKRDLPTQARFKHLATLEWYNLMPSIMTFFKNISNTYLKRIQSCIGEKIEGGFWVKMQATHSPLLPLVIQPWCQSCSPTQSFPGLDQLPQKQFSSCHLFKHYFWVCRNLCFLVISCYF